MMNKQKYELTIYNFDTESSPRNRIPLLKGYRADERTKSVYDMCMVHGANSFSNLLR